MKEKQSTKITNKDESKEIKLERRKDKKQMKK
jgi:hypothetical protein